MDILNSVILSSIARHMSFFHVLALGDFLYVINGHMCLYAMIRIKVIILLMDIFFLSRDRNQKVCYFFHSENIFSIVWNYIDMLEGCNAYFFCVTIHLNVYLKKLFYYVHGCCGAQIQTGCRRDDLSLSVMSGTSAVKT